jgi:hypothetical protein
VTTPEKPDPARGWLFVENLLAEDELERIEKLSDEEIAEELRAAGVTRVPTADEMMAKAAKRADAAEAKEKEKENEREKEAGTAQADDKVPAPARAARPATSIRRTVWLIAAVLGAFLVLVFVYRNRGAIEAWFNGEPIRPDDQWLPWKPSPTPQERAAKIREDAFAACRQEMYETCGRKLDEAREVDPGGEADPRVVAARQSIEAALGDAAVDGGRKPDKAPHGP